VCSVFTSSLPFHPDVIYPPTVRKPHLERQPGARESPLSQVSPPQSRTCIDSLPCPSSRSRPSFCSVRGASPDLADLVPRASQQMASQPSVGFLFKHPRLSSTELHTITGALPPHLELIGADTPDFVMAPGVSHHNTKEEAYCSQSVSCKVMKISIPPQ
jgi:hypothetical protein